MKKIKTTLDKVRKWFGVRPLFIKIVLVLIILVAGWGVFSGLRQSRSEKVQYQTAVAERGTLITSISGSGTITSANYTNINTKVSGVVSKVYVTNGDMVVKGQKIAEVTLDDYAKERQTAAWVSYLEATEAVKQAEKDKVSADIQMWKDQQAVLDAQEAYNNRESYTGSKRMIIEKTLVESRRAFSVSESKYLNADANIANAKAKVSAALRNYQENSAVIVAPATGVISNLALAEGLIVSASSTTSSTSGATIVSAQTVGKISDPKGRLIASVNLSEIDVVNVRANQKVTLTLDAYPEMTFTGKVLAVNTSGSVSSGVTSYPVTLLLDSTSVDIYPNMAVNAQIITNLVTDVILVPTTAVSAGIDQSTVQVVKDGQIETVAVEVGDSNDSQTVIVSGIDEGDEVITSTITSGGTSQTNTNSTTSPFSGLGTRSGNSSGSRIFIQEGPRGF